MKNNELMVIFLCMLLCAQFAQPTSTQKSKPRRKTYFQGELYLQKLYSGTNPLDNLKYSEPDMKLRYLTLTPKLLYYSVSAKNKMEIEEAIYLDTIVDKKGDNVNIGKCCINVKYVNYRPKQLEIAKKIPLKSNKMMVFQKQNHADFCLEVLAPQEARWRICSKTPLDIYRLHLKLVFAVTQLNVSPTTSQKVLIDKFLSNSLLVSEKLANTWNWETQNQWGGQCKSSFMQSPLPIEDNDEVINVKQEMNFKISHNLLDTNVQMVRRFNEIVITFLNDPGYFRIQYKSNSIVYRPKYISFRFPAEHVLFGKRYNGEMQIHCKEVTKDNKKMRTNGFVFSVPLSISEQHINLEVFESLNIDFWKFEVNQSHNGMYRPLDYISKKAKPFKLSKLMKIITDSNPVYFFYLGSLTTPPCDEFVNHLVASKPLMISNCQLKTLRENSLATSAAKQIHARMEKADEKDDDDKDKNKGDKKKGKGSGNGRGNGFGGGRGIYGISSLSNDPNIELYIDESLRMPALTRKTGLFKFREGFKEDEDDLNC